MVIQKKEQEAHLQPEMDNEPPVLEGVRLTQPSNVLALQRTVGNQAAKKLLEDQGAVVQRNWNKGTVTPNTTRSTKFKMGTGTGKASAKPVFGPSTTDNTNMQDMKFGGYQAYKTGKRVVGSTQSIVENSGNTAPTVISQQEYAGQFSTAASVLSDAAAGGSVIAIQAALSGFIGLVMPYVKLVRLAIKIPTSIYKTHKTRKDMQALKKAYKGSEEKAKSGDSVAQTVYDAAKYGYKKVRRQFAERIAKVIMTIAKFAMTITDLVTGGTAILFTSIGKLLTSVAKGVITGISAGKAIYKTVTGKKGVNRRLNAETFINAANSGNEEALMMFYKMKVGKSLYFEQQGIQLSKNPLKKKPPFFKNNQRGYSAWLRTLTGTEWGSLREELEKKLKSSTTKSFTERRKAAMKKLGIK